MHDRRYYAAAAAVQGRLAGFKHAGSEKKKKERILKHE